MPAALRSFITASATVGKPGMAANSPASKPLGYPASASSCLALAGSYGGGSTCSAKSMTRGTITPVGGQKPRHAASLICWRFSAWFTASRIRLSCHGDFGSHWSANSTQKIDACFEGTTCIRGSRLRPSASGPSSTYPISASPLLSITARVVDSGTLFMTSVFTLGTRRQYPGYASSTTSTPGLWLTNLYGPAPIGCFLKASSPTSVRYFLGTTIPAAVAVVP